MLKLMGNSILRMVASQIQSAEFVSIMMDECTDSRNKEQVLIILIAIIIIVIIILLVIIAINSK